MDPASERRERYAGEGGTEAGIREPTMEFRRSSPDGSLVLIETKSHMVTMALGDVLKRMGYHPLSREEFDHAGLVPSFLFVDSPSLGSSLPVARNLNPSVRTILVDLGTDGPLASGVSSDVQAVVPVHATAKVLERTIDAVERGRHPTFPDSRVASIYGAPIELTPRQRDILRLARQGLTRDQMAVSLLISRHTLRTHLHRMYARFGIRNRAVLTILAIKLLAAG